MEKTGKTFFFSYKSFLYHRKNLIYKHSLTWKILQTIWSILRCTTFCVLITNYIIEGINWIIMLSYILCFIHVLSSKENIEQTWTCVKFTYELPYCTIGISWCTCVLIPRSFLLHESSLIDSNTGLIFTLDYIEISILNIFVVLNRKYLSMKYIF